MFKINEIIKIILILSVLLIMACDQNVGKRNVTSQIEVQNAN